MDTIKAVISFISFILFCFLWALAGSALGLILVIIERV